MSDGDLSVRARLPGMFVHSRGLIPSFVRQTGRRLHRGYVFRRALRDFAQTVAAGATPSDDLLRALVYGWGNEAYSARGEFLATVLSHGRIAEGPILECGSGLSTLLLGMVSRQEVWSLEHDPVWERHSRAALEKHGIHRARILTAPLRDYGGFTWYAPPFARMPSCFALVVCDGPPGVTPGGRYGLFPVMAQRLGSGCTVLLDDVDRPGERRIIEQWASELKTSFSIRGERQRYAVLTLPD